MQPDRFTIKSQEALEAAQLLAAERRNPQTRPEHLLAVLLEQDGGVVVPVLRKLGVDPAAMRQALEPALEALPRLASAGSEPTGGSNELLEVLRAAEAEMRALGDELHLHRAPRARARQHLRARPATCCARSAPATTRC